MAPDSQTRKIFLILLSFTLLLTTVSAAELELEDNTLWLNDKDAVEAEVTGEDVDRLEIVNYSGTQNPKKLLDGKNGSVETQDIIDAVGEDKNNYTLELYDSSQQSQPKSTADVFVKELDLSIENNGTGYVNRKLGEMPYTDSLKLTLAVKAYNNEEIDKEDISRDNFQVTSREAEFTDPTDVNAVQTGDDRKKVEATLSPLITEEHPQDENLNLQFTYTHEGSSVSLNRRFNPKIYERRGEPITSPPSQLYANEIGKYEYTVNVFENGEDTTPELWENAYDLKIVELDNGEEVDEILEDEEWLSVQQVEGGDGDQRLTLNSIPQLETGTYKLITRLKQPDTDDYSVVDSIRVRNGLKLSGRVVDSENRGVRTEMSLDRDGTVIPINTGEDGTYYKEIDTSGDDSSYTVTMNFFDRGMSSSDAEITARNVDFAEKDGENLAGDSESIKFQYWDDPPVEQKAITPINMMATKFAYPIADDGHKVRMKFNPADVDTDNLKVYGCSQWNFEGRTCLGSWEVVDDFSINYQGWRANFDINDPYLAEDTGPDGDEDRNILMNAYIIGTSADLVLNGGLSVSGPEGGTVATGSQIEVSGNINSENENPVEGADVEVSFYQGDNEISSLDTVQTDITGQFSATGEAPDEPGNYSVKVTAEKENYNMMERKFDNRFETVIEEGIAVRTGSTLEVSPGEEATSEITVRNTGQTDMEDVSLSFSGLDSQYYSVSQPSFDEIPAGEESSTEITISLPSDYCDDGCGDWPSLEVSATATNPDGEEFEADAETLQLQINRLSDQNDSEESDQATSETSETNDSDSSFTQSVSDLENATGEFIASQSSLNLALGLIMVFMMVLAGAVKKQDNGSGRSSGSRGDRDGRGGRPRVQKPDVGGSSEVKQVETDQEVDEVDNVVDQIESDDQNVDSQIDAIAGSVVGEEQEDTKVVEVEDENQDSGSESTNQETLESEEVDVEEKFVCEETGEEFDTKAALKLHRQINGLDN